MYQSLNEFYEEWKYEAESTSKMLEALTDESLSQLVSAEDRTLGRIAWHIVVTIHEMMSHAGLQFDASGEGTGVPKSAQEIANQYRQASQAMIDAIKEQWNDATLEESRNMYGDLWKVHTVLNALNKHQIHHRGQMTVLMRQAGIQVPGVYGPSRNEWEPMGMPIPQL